MSSCKRGHNWKVAPTGLKCMDCGRATAFELIPEPAFERILKGMRARKSATAVWRFKKNYLRSRDKKLPPPEQPWSFTDQLVGESFAKHLAGLKHPGAGKGGRKSKWQ